MTYEVGSRYPKPGDKVKVAEKKNYVNGKLTEGTVKDILTRQQTHPRGHKVRLTNGIIGRVRGFVDEKKGEEYPPAAYTPREDELV